MKKIVLLLALFFTLSTHIFAVTYYVCFLEGNDENNGILPSSPWKTLNKVNIAKFLPGDSILFKRGEIWRGQLIPVSGDSSGYITYSSYGKLTASKPLILGSVSRKSPEDWENSKTNIWTTVTSKSNKNPESDRPLDVDIGNIIFNSGDKCGVKVWDESSLGIQGEFWYDKDHKIVKLYSICNPANYYSNIELALKHHIIDQNNRNYIKYENLDLRYGAAHGIGGANVHDIIVRNCDISFIGGALHTYTESGKPVRFGNGIEFWDNAHDCYVINCKISDIYDAALTNQGTDSVIVYNIYYWNNIIWNSEYSFEYWLGNYSKASHVYFENNTCVYAGNGWAHNQRPDHHNGRHLMFYDNLAKIDNFYIRNNIFSESTESAVRLSARWVDLANLSMDHNLYFESSGKIADWQGTSYSFQNFKTFQKDTGKDKSSIFANPFFVNASKFDFHLCSNSPAINSGMDTGNFRNSMRKVQKKGPHYDIGAIEYGSAKTGVVKIGIVTDTHYDRVTYPERTSVAQNIVNTFNSEKVNVILGLGDMYEGNFDNLQDFLNDQALYEVPWRSSNAPVYWALGNHDNWGITDDQYISNNSFIHSRNYTVDLDCKWRIIIYSNGDGHYFEAGPAALTWLKTDLEQARLDGKKIIIAAHVRIDQDYPGNPPSYTSEPYSSFSYNANQQRNIINTAKANGADIKYVFHGHDHKNSKATINGITYYSFKNAGDDGSCAIISIQDNDTLKITGFGSQITYK